MYNAAVQKNSSLLEIHAAVVLFGLAGLFGKWLPLSPFIIVLGRVFFASIALGLILLLGKHGFRIKNGSDGLLFFGLGLLLALHWVSFFKSIQVSTVAVGLLSYSSFPVFTAFLEPYFLKVKPDPMNVLFAFVCLFGVFLIIPRFALSDSTLKGVLFGLLAGLTFSLLSIINRKLTQRYSSLLIAFYQDFFAMLLLLPFFFLIGPATSSKDILLLLFLGVVCTAVAHTLFIKGMKEIQAQTASIISSLEPVYGIILAFLFLREVPAGRTVLGGVIILGAVLFISLRTMRKPRPSFNSSGRTGS
jgi:drug/metabolite transporter (DMT)-like permease